MLQEMQSLCVEWKRSKLTSIDDDITIWNAAKNCKKISITSWWLDWHIDFFFFKSTLGRKTRINQKEMKEMHLDCVIYCHQSIAHHSFFNANKSSSGRFVVFILLIAISQLITALIQFYPNAKNLWEEIAKWSPIKHIIANKHFCEHLS